MEPEQIDVYSHAMNSCVVKMPERQSPGIVIQGDSLALLFDTTLEIVERLEATGDEDLFLRALQMAEALETYLVNYERALEQHQIPLPYHRDASRNTQNFLKHWDKARA